MVTSRVWHRQEETRPQPLSWGNHHFRVPILSRLWRRQYRRRRYLARRDADAAESVNLCMRGHLKRENREILLVCIGQREVFTSRWNGQKTFPTVILT